MPAPTARTSWVVVQHHLDERQIRAALASTLTRDTAQRTPADERFYLQLSPKLLLVAPDRESLQPRNDFALTAPPEGTLGTLCVDAPSRALRDLPIELPPTIHWLRGIIQPTAGNGIAVDIEAGDEGIELAKHNAKELSRSVLSLRTKDHVRFIERATFEPRDSVIVGRLEVTPLQLGALLGVLSERVKAPPDPPPRLEPAANEDDGAGPERAAERLEALQAHKAPASDAVSQPDASPQNDGGNSAPH